MTNTPDYHQRFRERFAAIEHARWARWQAYLHSKGHESSGYFLIPMDLIERWERQITTPYEELSEAEKDSDRKEVEEYWPLIDEVVAEETGGFDHKRCWTDERHEVEVTEARAEERSFIIAEIQKFVDRYDYSMWSCRESFELLLTALRSESGEKECGFMRPCDALTARCVNPRPCPTHDESPEETECCGKCLDYDNDGARYCIFDKACLCHKPRTEV